MVRPGADDLSRADRTDARLGEEDRSKPVNQADHFLLGLGSFDAKRLCPTSDRAQGLDRDLKLHRLLRLATQLRASRHQGVSGQPPEAATKRLRCADHKCVQLAECLGARLEGSPPSREQNPKRLPRSLHSRRGQLVVGQGFARGRDRVQLIRLARLLAGTTRPLDLQHPLTMLGQKDRQP